MMAAPATTWDDACAEHVADIDQTWAATKLGNPTGRRWNQQTADEIMERLAVCVRRYQELDFWAITEGFKTLGVMAIGELAALGHWRMESGVKIAQYGPPSKQAVNLMTDLLISKQHDYGPNNINAFGMLGLIVRMNDKIARIARLMEHGLSPRNESLLDSFRDVIGYTVVALMYSDGTFQLPLAGNLLDSPIEG